MKRFAYSGGMIHFCHHSFPGVAMFTRLMVAIVLLGTAPPALMGQPIMLGQIDTFQNGTIQNWRYGINAATSPVNVPNGGPQGAGDRYLQVTSGFPDPPRLAVFNISQWTG